MRKCISFNIFRSLPFPMATEVVVHSPTASRVNTAAFLNGDGNKHLLHATNDAQKKVTCLLCQNFSKNFSSSLIIKFFEIISFIQMGIAKAKLKSFWSKSNMFPIVSQT